ncbi:hypothetical protein METH_09165 [Leisingera methylohalidivorans DSM 14336]|uniref:Uncharacterized protein n=1 Tax=Leisingera methylohalidivorans DSM 14336 TaxID=999552 RepID=V9VYK0_9RHOB|nr:hypothetical protein METH_09165 [Leisingera methylohalidivorans DSM 14336]
MPQAQIPPVYFFIFRENAAAGARPAEAGAVQWKTPPPFQGAALPI